MVLAAAPPPGGPPLRVRRGGGEKRGGALTDPTIPSSTPFSDAVALAEKVRLAHLAAAYEAQSRERSRLSSRARTREPSPQHQHGEHQSDLPSQSQFNLPAVDAASNKQVRPREPSPPPPTHPPRAFVPRPVVPRAPVRSRMPAEPSEPRSVINVGVELGAEEHLTAW